MFQAKLMKTVPFLDTFQQKLNYKDKDKNNTSMNLTREKSKCMRTSSHLSGPPPHSLPRLWSELPERWFWEMNEAWTAWPFLPSPSLGDLPTCPLPTQVILQFHHRRLHFSLSLSKKILIKCLLHAGLFFLQRHPCPQGAHHSRGRQTKNKDTDT